MSPTAPPRFTLICAMYGVARFLPDFISSIERQTFALERVQVVIVDDGSVDGSLAIAQAWVDRQPALVTLVRQDNAGQAVARNTGLKVASGEWVSFPDPDDVISDRYLESVDRFLTQHAETDLVATNRWIWNDGISEATNTHPLRHMFESDRLVDLASDEHHFQGSAPAAFFRRERLVELELQFDPRIQPAFEDAHFTISYLLECDQPQVGFLQSAQYHYRKRSDGSSTLQRARAHPGRYNQMLELGYLDVVRHAHRRLGHVPGWLQAHLVFDLSWYFTLTDAHVTAGTPSSGEAAERLHVLMTEILGYVDVDHFVPRSVIPIGRVPRYVLQHGYAQRSWHEPWAVFTHFDPVQRLARLEYFFSGVGPTEELLVDGKPAAPLHAKTMEYSYGGRVLLSRRVLWAPANRVTSIRLDGELVEILFRRPTFPTTSATPRAIRWNLGERGGWARREGRGYVDPIPRTRSGKLARRLHYRGAVRRRYARAWVLMDGIHVAGDSAEVLFKHLRSTHPDLNAWFVIKRDSPDWERLRNEGFGRRLIPHGSMSWRLLMANADHLISTRDDEAITHPPAILDFMRPPWRFAFLGHDLIETDASVRLNRKPIQTVITSSSYELTAVAGDSSYDYSTREVHLTGVPRLDRIQKIAEARAVAGPDLLIIAPLDFDEHWRVLLADERLRAAASSNRLTITVLVPAEAKLLADSLDAPSWVEQLTYDGLSAPTHLARARVFVTDFSPAVLDLVYLERPVVYLRAGTEVVSAEDHAPRRPPVDYAHAGFGPLTTSAADAVASVLEALAHGPTLMEPYRERILDALPLRDGQSSERVCQAILHSVADRSQDTPEATPTLSYLPNRPTGPARSGGPGSHD